MRFGTIKPNGLKLIKYFLLSIRLPYWLFYTIIFTGSAPYLLLFIYLLDKETFILLIKLTIVNSKEVFIIVSTFLLIRNGIDLIITKKLVYEKGVIDAKTAQDAKETMRWYSTITKEELFEVTASIKREKRERLKDHRDLLEMFNKIKEQHIDLRVQVATLLILTKKNYDKGKDK